MPRTSDYLAARVKEKQAARQPEEDPADEEREALVEKASRHPAGGSDGELSSPSQAKKANKIKRSRWPEEHALATLAIVNSQPTADDAIAEDEEVQDVTAEVKASKGPASAGQATPIEAAIRRVVLLGVLLLLAGGLWWFAQQRRGAAAAEVEPPDDAPLADDVEEEDPATGPFAVAAAGYDEEAEAGDEGGAGGASEDPVNFIVISTRGSGAHFMMEMLSSHPDIESGGELLVDRHHRRSKMSSNVQKFFTGQGSARVKGFMANGAPQWRGWGMELQKYNVKVIYLWRINKVRHIISERVRNQTEGTAKWRSGLHPKTPTELEEARAIKPMLPYGAVFDDQIKFWEKEEALAQSEFGGFPSLRVRYEDIVATNPSCQDQWAKIQRFINVKPRGLSSPYPAIHQFLPIKDTVGNWPQARAFLNTRAMLGEIGNLERMSGSAQNAACGGDKERRLEGLAPAAFLRPAANRSDLSA